MTEAGSRSRHSAKAREDLGPGPVRTCVGCRERDLADRLVRLALVAAPTDVSVVVVDSGRRLPGRGAWLHPELRCLELAERRRAIARALHLAGPVDAQAVRDALVATEADPVGGASPPLS